MSEKQTIKINEQITVVFETRYDNDYEPDFLGEFAKYSREWCIDRKRQVLLGEAVEEPKWSERQEELEDTVSNYNRYHDNIREGTEEEYEELEALRRDFDKAYEQWEDNYGLKVLSEDVYVHHRFDASREYRFFYPPIENYEGCTEEEKIEYCLQDHQRYERLLDQDWWFLGFEATVLVEGIEVANASLWGIESDGDKAYKDELWGDLLSDCFHKLEDKIEDKMSQLQEQMTALAMARDAIPSKETIKDLVKEID